ncbi:hypothetical protein H0H93_006264 [Arthromyces matolae]|nr:hypothetical protein H0H93_006264 [Arthromyces matolae]
MFARQTLARATQAAVPNGARNMATLREIELRLKSVRNIQKITQSMKVVASTKLAKAQRAMQAGKEYGIANAEVFANSPSDTPAKTRLFLVISSDKGLCGGIHSAVSKATRRAINNAEDSPLPGEQVDSESPVMIIGDKSKGQLQRTLGQNIRLTFNQIGRDIPTFADAAGVADLIVKSGVQYDSVVLIYNKFVSAISYEPAAMEVKGVEGLKDSNAFKAYENEDDATKDLAEFSLANAIFAALTESHACEQSSRRNAMDNASKNAGEMIGSLTMQYNRGRQAAITNELVDIITGLNFLRWICGRATEPESIGKLPSNMRTTTMDPPNTHSSHAPSISLFHRPMSSRSASVSAAASSSFDTSATSPKYRTQAKAWIDPASLPNYGDVKHIRGNAPDYVKQLNSNTFYSYGVGDEDCFGHKVGKGVRFVDVNIDRRQERQGRMEATTVAEVVVTKRGFPIDRLPRLDMLNGAGMLHGGCVAYLIDNCCSTPLVVLGLLQNVNGVGVTQAMNILFHSPASIGTLLSIVSTSISLGGRVMTSRCEVIDKDSGRVVASAFLNKMQPGVPKL